MTAAEPAAAAPAPAPTRPRARRWPRRVAMALAGIVVGLGVAECAFRVRDHHGFNKLNVYVADRELGVRLEPGATQRLVFPGTHATSIRINQQGYRGADFPTAGADDVVVVGDSQVFGLGVEEGETFSAGLQRALGGQRHVLNAGVPTYGPDEYAAVARELIASRHPRTVVFTVNMVNDLFEATRPNRARHVVRDGWAVRAEVAGSVTDFPGRGWLARHSHLFFALRQAWHKKTDGTEVASEGTWRDLVDTGTKSAAAQAELQRVREAHHAEVRAVETKLDQQIAAVDEAISDYLQAELKDQDYVALQAGHLQPGDSVSDPFDGAEEARAVVVTAAHIRRGALLRQRLRARLTDVIKAKLRGDARAELLGSVADEPVLEARLAELTQARVSAALDSPVAPAIRALKADCDRAGVRLVVLILPIDVAVSAEEWKKYRATPVDMSSGQALIDEITALGGELGVSTLDATAVLRAAEPGAFLDHDIHMTPRGHAAVATALAQTLATPAPAPVLANARPWLPRPAQWRAVQEITVTGSSAARCETKVVGGWLRVVCVPDPSEVAESVPSAITVVEDSTGTAMTMVLPRTAALTVAMAPGDHVRADFVWGGVQRQLEVSWPAGAAAASGSFTVTSKTTPATRTYNRPFASPLAQAVCRCWQGLYRPSDPGDPDRPYCPGAYGALDDGCAGYQASCDDLIACTLRDPARPPRAAVPK